MIRSPRVQVFVEQMSNEAMSGVWSFQVRDVRRLGSEGAVLATPRTRRADALTTIPQAPCRSSRPAARPLVTATVSLWVLHCLYIAKHTLPSTKPATVYQALCCGECAALIREEYGLERGVWNGEASGTGGEGFCSCMSDVEVDFLIHG
jgi:hypothetical protein